MNYHYFITGSVAVDSSSMNISKTFISLLLAMAFPVIAGKCPVEPRGTTKRYEGTCLEFIKQELRQPDAKKLCEENNGHLVTIENHEKQVWLENTLRDDVMWLKLNVWIGIVRDDNTHPNWYMDNGMQDSQDEFLKYSNWDVNEPEDNRDRACAVFGNSNDFKWRASICNRFPYDFLTVCQYDGPEIALTTPAVYVTAILLPVIGLTLAIFFIYYCHRKRKALQNQLRKSRTEDMYDEESGEHHIMNTENNMDSNYTPNNNNPPNHYTPVINITANTNSYHNFNIQSDSAYRQDKLRKKDLSLQTDSMLIAAVPTQPLVEYSRSVSSPPNFATPTAPPCEEFKTAIEEEDHNEDETSPLHKQRPRSLDSNDLSV